MSKRKNQIAQKLVEGGACFAVTDRKCVLPDDEFGAHPSYHVHPDTSYPHVSQIKRFADLDILEAYANAKALAAGLWKKFQAGEITFEEYNAQGSKAMEDFIL